MLLVYAPCVVASLRVSGMRSWSCWADWSRVWPMFKPRSKRKKLFSWRRGIRLWKFQGEGVGNITTLRLARLFFSWPVRRGKVIPAKVIFPHKKLTDKRIHVIFCAVCLHVHAHVYYTAIKCIMFLPACRSCEQQLKSCDDAFRCQLEAKQKAHDNHVTKVAAEKDKEIAQANQRVGQCRLLSQQTWVITWS